MTARFAARCRHLGRRAGHGEVPQLSSRNLADTTWGLLTECSPSPCVKLVEFSAFRSPASCSSLGIRSGRLGCSAVRSEPPPGHPRPVLFPHQQLSQGVASPLGTLETRHILQLHELWLLRAWRKTPSAGNDLGGTAFACPPCPSQGVSPALGSGRRILRDIEAFP